VEPDSTNEGATGNFEVRRAKVLSELLEGPPDNTGGVVYLEMGWLDANFEIHQVFGFFYKIFIFNQNFQF
jgi:hypothetical protein